MISYLILAAVTTFLVFGLYSYYRQSRKTKYLAVTEYWVYLPGESMPPQNDVMELVLKGGGSAIGPREGLLFSDIRLHIALVLRSRNPHVFRPDLFAEYIEPTAELLDGLSRSHALAKIRYMSTVPLKDDAHLQLLPYLAYAYTKLGNATVVYDVIAEQLMSVEELKQSLKQDSDATRADLHVRAVWVNTESGGRGETKGLVKKGLPELITAEMEPDEKVLVTSVLEEAAKRLWEHSELPESVEVESFGDQFKLLLKPAKPGEAQVRILRVQNA